MYFELLRLSRYTCIKDNLIGGCATGRCNFSKIIENWPKKCLGIANVEWGPGFYWIFSMKAKKLKIDQLCMWKFRILKERQISAPGSPPFKQKKCKCCHPNHLPSSKCEKGANFWHPCHLFISETPNMTNNWPPSWIFGQWKWENRYKNTSNRWSELIATISSVWLNKINKIVYPARPLS